MKKITIDIKFTSASGGNVSVQLLGPHTNITYLAAAGDPPQHFNLNPAGYSIIANGLSGGTCNLTVSDHAGVPIATDSCPPTHIYIAKIFTVI